MAVPKVVQDQLDKAVAMEEKLRSGLGPVDVPQASDADPVVTPVITPQPHEVAGISPHDETYWQQQAQTEAGRVKAISEQNAKNAEAITAYQAREGELRRELEATKAQLIQSQATAQTSDFELMIEEMATDPERADEAEMLKHLHETSLSQAQVIRELQGARETQVLSSNDLFWKAVNEQIPDRLTIDEDPVFNQWVNTVEPQLAALTGRNETRQQLLRQAVREVGPHNVDQCVQRVVNIYTQWKGASQSPQTYNPDPSATGDPLITDKGIQWNEAKMKAFYAKAGKNQYTQEEFASLESDLNRAVAEGRYKKV